VKKNLSAQEMTALFDLKPYLKHVDYIFGRVFGDAKAKKR